MNNSAIVAGAAIALIICILFGVLDIQCGGGNWNAEYQVCEP